MPQFRPPKNKRPLPGPGSLKPLGVLAGPKPQPAPYQPPWETDPLSQSGFAQANQSYGNTIGYIGANRESLEHRYGYNQNGELLSNNPYSLANLLERRHQAERRGTMNSAGLNLYAGSTINHLNQADFRFGQSQNQLKEQFSSELTKLHREEQEASEAKAQAEQEAKERAIERQGQEPLPTVPAPRTGFRRRRKRNR